MEPRLESPFNNLLMTDPTEAFQEEQAAIESADASRAREAHLASLRRLQQRYNACEESGNSNGAERIQQLIDAENERWKASGNAD